MSTDWRSLCEALVDEWDAATDHDLLAMDEAVDRARTALAEPQGEGPTDQQIADAFAEGCRDVGKAGEPPFLSGARAVLARWGRPAPLPSDDGPAVPEGREPASVDQQATAGELLQAYQAGRRDAQADERWAADAAQDLPTDGEVGEVIGELRDAAFDRNGSDPERAMLTRAADLLTRLALQPVPVSERLPGAEDCDAEGLCWVWHATAYTWGLFRLDLTAHSHWLPAHALPLPREVQP